MLVVEKSIISDDIADVKFCCDLKKCKGYCCVEGDSGAPLEEEEISVLEDVIDEVIPFMTEKGIKTIKKTGVFDYDAEGNYVTPLNNGLECAFTYFEDGIAKCAIEKAFNNNCFKNYPGAENFNKPISCYLYPVRITSNNGYDAINYHRWNICKPALKKGKATNTPLYVFLKKPLIKKYGEKWYNTLVEQIEKKINSK
ncbi:MAG: DUF3109 family protein [Bacteroidales bacterium]|nr:DUF3109 family protein [Bacteroidales bacterium]